jgi:hypothetical protein
MWSAWLCSAYAVHSVVLGSLQVGCVAPMCWWHQCAGGTSVSLINVLPTSVAPVVGAEWGAEVGWAPLAAKCWIVC